MWQALGPVLILLLGGLGWVIKRQYDRNAEIESQLSAKKFEVYSTIAAMLFDIFMSKDDSEAKAQAFFKNASEHWKTIMIYASDEVIKEFIALLSGARTGASPAVSLEQMGRVMVAVRKDMGNANTKVDARDFMMLVINDYEKSAEPGGLFHELDQKYARGTKR